jgi:glycosyltransferase involved in cell wall biosynthesis
MKILYLMTEPFGYGGVQSDLLALGEAYVNKGHEVFVLTSAGERSAELRDIGVNEIDIDTHFHGPLDMWKLGREIRSITTEHEMDLIAPQSVRTTIASWLGLRAGGNGTSHIPIVSTVHNIHSAIHFRWGGRILRHCADYVIFESHYERNRLLKSGLSAPASSVIHSGIDTERFCPALRDPELAAQYGIKPEHIVFGLIARLSEEKGHQYLVEAFSRVEAKNDNVRLMIVGDGPLRTDVQQRVDEHGVRDKVIFTGSQRNIPEHLSLIDVFTLTSTRESFPLSAREAMACGIPVIAPAIGGCGEVVTDGETGYLFEVANVDDLADRMTKLLDARQRRVFGSAGREKAVKLFSRNQWIDGDEAVYDEFLSRARGHVH